MQRIGGNYIRSMAAQAHPAPSRAADRDFWWTDYRKARLCYIMDRWNDVDKAARVLGAMPHNCAYRWNRMSEEERNRLRKTENYR